RRGGSTPWCFAFLGSNREFVYIGRLVILNRRARATQRSANAFALGARNGVRMISNALAAEDLVEGATELAVAIVDQEPGRLSLARRTTRQAAGLAGLSSLRRGSRCSLRDAHAGC